MAIKTINKVSDSKGLKILKTPCVPIANILPEHDALIADLVDTANANPGCVGLSANQIWENPDEPAPAIFIVPGGSKDQWAVCINPEIDQVWKKMIKQREACMSIPGYQTIVERPRHINVSFYDIEKVYQQNIHMFDIMARIFLHEFDHLQGKLINE